MIVIMIMGQIFIMIIMIIVMIVIILGKFIGSKWLPWLLGSSWSSRKCSLDMSWPSSWPYAQETSWPFWTDYQGIIYLHFISVSRIYNWKPLSGIIMIMWQRLLIFIWSRSSWSHWQSWLNTQHLMMIMIMICIQHMLMMIQMINLIKKNKMHCGHMIMMIIFILMKLVSWTYDYLVNQSFQIMIIKILMIIPSTGDWWSFFVMGA